MISWLVLACSGLGPQVPPQLDSGFPKAPETTEPSTDPGTPFSEVRAAALDVYGSIVRVEWVQSEAATVHVEFFDRDEPERVLSTPPRDLEPGFHEELLIGMPYGSEFEWVIVTSQVTSRLRTVQNSPIPPTVPTAEVLAYDPDSVDPDSPYFLVGVTENGSLQRTWILLLDREGQVLWAHRTPNQRNSMQPRVSLDGTSFLVDHSSYFANLASQGEDSEIVELKIDGRVVRSWDAPGQHHPFVELPDGRIAYARYDFGLWRDDRIEIISEFGNDLTTLFSCRQFIEDNGLPLGNCGSNTTSYDATRDTFLFSMFTFDSVLEIDARTGEVEHVFSGDLSDPSRTGLPAWGFSPPSSRFDYQHNPIWTEAGTLLLSTHVSEESNELVVREYRVDEGSDTLEQIWSFGEGEGIPGCQMGEAHRLAGGNTLHNYGTYARLREVTPDRRVVWDIQWEDRQYSCGGGPQTPGHQVVRSNPVGPDLYRFAPERR